MIRVYAVNPLEMGLPHVRCLIVVEKISEPKSPSQSKPPEQTLSYYLSSHHPAPAEFFAGLIRGHWGGCEIRNHWVRDALFEEDKTRSKNQNLNGNLAVLRCALIALKSRLAPSRSWPAIRELASMNPSVPYQWIFNNRAK